MCSVGNITKSEQKSYDIIIPAEEKDIGFLPRVLDYLYRYLSDIGHIYILTSQRNFKSIGKFIKNYPQCVVLDENKIIIGVDIDKVRMLIGLKYPQYENYAGWYFQQFLKLGFSLSPYCRDYYLSWDADTLPLSSLSFFEGGHILYNPKPEYNENYFKTIYRLLGLERVVDRSFISESMMFSAVIVREMLEKISSCGVEGSTWVEKILMSCDLSIAPQAFSEFETYGNYCMALHPGLYIPRHLNTFRHAGMINGRRLSDKKLEKLSFDVNMASFEYKDWPMFPYNLPDMINYAGRLFRKMRRMTLKEIVHRFLMKYGKKL